MKADPQLTNQGENHDSHRVQDYDDDCRSRVRRLERPRGFLRAFERQESRAFPAFRDEVRHGTNQPARPDVRPGRKTLRRGGRCWRLAETDGRARLPDRHQCLQPLHRRLQRPRDPRARQRQEGGGRGQTAQHDRSLRRQLRPHRCRLHRQHAVRPDRDGRVLARHARRLARDSAGQSRWFDHQCRQSQCVALGEPAATSSRTRTPRRRTRNQAECSTR